MLTLTKEGNHLKLPYDYRKESISIKYSITIEETNKKKI